MSEWWQSLTYFQQVFACIAIPATILLFLQTILLAFGLGHHDADADHDFGHDFGHDMDHDFGHDFGHDFDHGDGIFGEHDGFDHSHDMGLRLFTVRGITAFLAVFGWCAVAINDSLPTFMSILISVTAGFFIMFLMALAMWWFTRLQSDGSMDMRNALGSSGSVYLKIPANRKGTGKININLQGSYSELTAVTDENEDIQFGEEVTVIGISGTSTLVVKRK